MYLPTKNQHVLIKMEELEKMGNERHYEGSEYTEIDHYHFEKETEHTK